MSRKLKKGYYVRGEFVAEGSPLDQAFKIELRGTDAASKTELKQASAELQTLGEELVLLRAGLMATLDLPEKLTDALAEAKRITNFEGKRRQMQFIGKLMRQLETSSPKTLDSIRQALAEQRGGSTQATLQLHEAEHWRQRLLADDDAFAAWLKEFPLSDAQQLRALIRQARKDATVQQPDANAGAGATPRHGRAYREIFQMVRDQLSQQGDEVQDD